MHNEDSKHRVVLTLQEKATEQLKNSEVVSNSVGRLSTDIDMLVLELIFRVLHMQDSPSDKPEAKPNLTARVYLALNLELAPDYLVGCFWTQPKRIPRIFLWTGGLSSGLGAGAALAGHGASRLSQDISQVYSYGETSQSSGLVVGAGFA